MFHSLWCLGAQRKGMVISMSLLEFVNLTYTYDGQQPLLRGASGQLEQIGRASCRERVSSPV